ncbi:uncharacterized protein LOC135199926 [Macrobrachium nipponense]|uniref:uncharacterized protein LOC135199926 n=1 Tax=Macrobrachium nipponense TaxID=159736 RepID=UPI0030C8BF60
MASRHGIDGSSVSRHGVLGQVEEGKRRFLRGEDGRKHQTRVEGKVCPGIRSAAGGDLGVGEGGGGGGERAFEEEAEKVAPKDFSLGPTTKDPGRLLMTATTKGVFIIPSSFYRYPANPLPLLLLLLLLPFPYFPLLLLPLAPPPPTPPPLDRFSIPRRWKTQADAARDLLLHPPYSSSSFVGWRASTSSSLFKFSSNTITSSSSSSTSSTFSSFPPPPPTAPPSSTPHPLHPPPSSLPPPPTATPTPTPSPTPPPPSSPPPPTPPPPPALPPPPPQPPFLSEHPSQEIHNGLIMQIPETDAHRLIPPHARVTHPPLFTQTPKELNPSPLPSKLHPYHFPSPFALSPFPLPLPSPSPTSRLPS